MTFNLLVGIETILLWVFLIGALVALWFFSKRSQQKREKEMQETLDAIKPGCKVKTIGGICGVVVEVNNEENTFVLETGSDAVGKSYVKFDKKAVYQTDAVAAPASETPVEETPEETPVEEAETPVEEAPFGEMETTAEETPVEETAETEEVAEKNQEE